MTIELSDPVAFSLGGLEVMWYGVFFAVGLFAGAQCLSRLGPRRDLNQDKLANLVLVLAVSAIAGARTLYVITHWPDFSGDLVSILNLRSGGLVFYGGLIGGTLGAIWWIRRHHLPFWHVADVCAVAIPLGHAFGRLGCLLNGCCHGRSGEWGLLYPVRSGAYYVALWTGKLEDFSNSVPVFPSQALMAASNLVLFGILLALFIRRVRPGLVFASYLVLYSVMRFLNEMTRGDYVTPGTGEPDLFAGFTIAQLVCFVLLPTGIFLWRYAYKHNSPVASGKK